MGASSRPMPEASSARARSISPAVRASSTGAYREAIAPPERSSGYIEGSTLKLLTHCTRSRAFCTRRLYGALPFSRMPCSSAPTESVPSALDSSISPSTTVKALRPSSSTSTSHSVPRIAASPAGVVTEKLRAGVFVSKRPLPFWKSMMERRGAAASAAFSCQVELASTVALVWSASSSAMRLSCSVRSHVPASSFCCTRAGRQPLTGDWLCSPLPLMLTISATGCAQRASGSTSHASRNVRTMRKLPPCGFGP